MSGGSFDYLYNKDLTEWECQVRRMADTLADMALVDASLATRKVVALMHDIDVIHKSLRNVWLAVEWKESGDWGEQHVIDAVHGWRDRESNPAPEVTSAMHQLLELEREHKKLADAIERLKDTIAKRWEHEKENRTG